MAAGIGMRALSAPPDPLLVLQSRAFPQTVDQKIHSAGLSARYFGSRGRLFRAISQQPCPLVLSHWNSAQRDSFCLLQGIQGVEPAALTVLLAPAIDNARLGQAYSAGATACVDDYRKLTRALSSARGLRDRLITYDVTLQRFRAFHKSLSRLSLDLPPSSDILSNILGQVRVVMAYDRAAVVLRKGERFVLIAAAGIPGLGEQLRETEFPPDVVPLLARLVAAGEPRLVAGPAPIFDHSFGCALIAPMLLPPHVEGALLLMSRRPDEYTNADMRQAGLLSDRFALALSNLCYYEELSKEARRLTSLLETSAELSQAQSVEAMLELAVTEAARLTSSKICTVRLVEGDFLTEGVAHGYLHPLSRLHRIRIDDRLSSIVHDLHPLIISDLMEDPGLPPSRRERSVREGVRAFLGVPMVHRGRGIGLFSLYKSGPHHWSEDEITLAGALAARTADEINSLRSYRRLAHPSA